MHPLRKHLASALRRLAYRIDQADVMSFAFHKMVVQQANAYILRTERYIVALEQEFVDAAYGIVSPTAILNELRKRHVRHDTSHFVKAQDALRPTAQSVIENSMKPSRDWPFKAPPTQNEVERGVSIMEGELDKAMEPRVDPK